MLQIILFDILLKRNHMIMVAILENFALPLQDFLGLSEVILIHNALYINKRKTLCIETNSALY